MMRPTGHPVAATERPLGPPLKPHPGTAQIPRHGEVRQTCEIYWRTKQGKQDRSVDRVGASLHVTITVMPDTANPVEFGPSGAGNELYVMEQLCDYKMSDERSVVQQAHEI